MLRNHSSSSQTEPTKLFVDAKYIAKKYGVSVRQIQKMATDNQIPNIRIGRRKGFRFDEQAVAAVLERKPAPARQQVRQTRPMRPSNRLHKLFRPEATPAMLEIWRTTPFDTYHYTLAED